MEFSILDSIPDLNNLKSFTDRYFSKRYAVNVNEIMNNDIMIMFHSNRMALLSLAPSHFFFNKNEKYNINFKVGEVDRLCNSVTGKGKKGGQALNPKSVICKVEFTDGTSFDVPCCIKGTLVEVNEGLVKHPELLKTLADSDGYIAIVLSRIAGYEDAKNKLLTHEDYLKLIKSNTND